MLQSMLNRKVRNTTSKPTNKTQQMIGTYRGKRRTKINLN